MWETIKNALIGVKDATGIEIPGLPVDLGSIGESASTASQSLSESATGAVEGAAAAADAAAQALPDIPGASTGAAR